eukprot:4879703-Pleurochrysis_carterae.AAC.1
MLRPIGDALLVRRARAHPDERADEHAHFSRLFARLVALLARGALPIGLGEEVCAFEERPWQQHVDLVEDERVERSCEPREQPVWRRAQSRAVGELRAVADAAQHGRAQLRVERDEAAERARRRDHDLGPTSRDLALEVAQLLHRQRVGRSVVAVVGVGGVGGVGGAGSAVRAIADGVAAAWSRRLHAA